MRLTNYSNYALRTLQMAALRAPDRVRIDEVALAHGIKSSHLTRIVHDLGQAGLLETRRGRGGGFRLARAADTITVGEVVRLTEGPLTLVECFAPASSTCPLTGICRLSAGLGRALTAFLAVLDDMTIADISANRSDLLARLPLPDKAGLPAAEA